MTCATLLPLDAVHAMLTRFRSSLRAKPPSAMLDVPFSNMHQTKAPGKQHINACSDTLPIPFHMSFHCASNSSTIFTCLFIVEGVISKTTCEKANLRPVQEDTQPKPDRLEGGRCGGDARAGGKSPRRRPLKPSTLLDAYYQPIAARTPNHFSPPDSLHKPNLFCNASDQASRILAQLCERRWSLSSANVRLLTPCC